MMEHLGVHRPQEEPPEGGLAMGTQDDKVIITLFGPMDDLVRRITFGHMGLAGYFAADANFAGLDDLFRHPGCVGFDGPFHFTFGDEGGIRALRYDFGEIRLDVEGIHPGLEMLQEMAGIAQGICDSSVWSTPTKIFMV
jgi:hypothetical protein